MAAMKLYSHWWMTDSKMKRNEDMIILVDIDDTIEDLVGAWCKWLNEKYGTSTMPEDITDWNMKKFFRQLTTVELFSPLLEEKFWETVQPREDAMKYLQRLYNKKYNIFLCTATTYQNVKMKHEKIVQRYFPYINWNHVIVTYRKSLINADYLVDDGIHNLENGNYQKILFSAPHNASYDAEKNGMFRVHGWEEVVDIIENRRTKC